MKPDGVETPRGFNGAKRDRRATSEPRPVRVRTAPLTEDEVVDAVCAYLERADWVVEQGLRTTERGTDIVARRPDRTVLRVEAKGATSSKAGTARHGRSFSRGQVASHVARAFYTAAAALDRRDSADRALSAVAFPETPHHRHFVNHVRGALDQLGIAVFWVDTPDRVRLEAPWGLGDP